jgi:hypothetical protein
MPIKFRCVYCEQLLGIARRKAGTVVKCPNCEGQLIVPTPDPADEAVDEKDDHEDFTEAAPQKEAPAAKKVAVPAAKSDDDTAGGMLFERDNFEELLKPAIEKKPAAKPAPKPVPAKTFDLSDIPEVAADSAPAAKGYVDSAFSRPPPPAPAVTPQAPAAKPKGIVLSPLKLVLLLLFILFMSGTSFVAGMFAGRLIFK